MADPDAFIPKLQRGRSLWIDSDGELVDDEQATSELDVETPDDELES